MSILIPGMEMPKDCGHCLLCEQDTIYDALVYRCLVTDNYLDDGYECQIMGNCPLVHIPPHGRLIDADEFFKALGMDDRVSILEAMYVQSILSDAPTIIPASKEGE